MFELTSAVLAGCFEIRPRVHVDARGSFVKVFHRDLFRAHGLETDFAEEYYSQSRRGVVRGMHFQVPPADHVKVVYCVHGEVFDVLLDLRVGSPSYGKVASFRLSAEQGNYLYIPKGVAHGFCAISETAIMVYKVGTVHDPEHEAGVRWDSIGIEWPVADPIVSERDARLPRLADFKSPFVHG